ncbi:undecaprenyl-phosphate glucose phosphotransferase [uncultured Paenalcaligenes sp.]|uniref:undecaprenyl-phosphate glucose phosphotransferase n=1 Tax=uncultured Paenalcaligenes sp. TaxID=1588925 RepID=UPI0026246BD0|nr:undecaprenyl-phosphate glucose phosphotransferase [uncultured Paenalcaligenes sp.]
MSNQIHTPPTIFAERYPVAFAAGVVDFALLSMAGHMAYWLRFDHWEMSEWYLLATLIFSLTIILCQAATQSYSSWRGQALIRPLGRVMWAWVGALFVLAVIAIAAKLAHYFSRYWMAYTVLFGLISVISFRLLVFTLLSHFRAKGKNQKNVVVIYDKSGQHSIFQQQDTLPTHGYSIRTAVPISDDAHFLVALSQTVSALTPHEVWICLPLSEGDKIKEVLHVLRHQTAEIRFIPDLSDLSLLNHRINQIAGMYSIDISCSPMDGSSRWLKRAEDLVLGSLIGLLILPVCALIYVSIKLTSPGPALFKQHRTGFNGKSFKVYKFRSMEVHNEKNGEVTQASANDPRITRLGAFLRKTSLDELPQFYNVLQGRMSIVGPRPHALAHNEHYKDQIESYMKRHKVKPGITGWAQVNGLRGETDTIEKMQRRVEFDLWYINNWSLWLDLKIITLTIFKGFINNKP